MAELWLQELLKYIMVGSDQNLVAIYLRNILIDLKETKKFGSNIMKFLYIDCDERAEKDSCPRIE